MNRKKCDMQTGRKILDLYSKHDFHHFPEIISHKIFDDKIILDFEWIEGEPITEYQIDTAFFELGKMHNQFKTADREYGFITICHGDFHLKNIINQSGKLFFIDVTYIHEGWNYSDFDYVDFFDIYDKKNCPWIIRSIDCLKAYQEGAGIKTTKEYDDVLKRKITCHMLENNIRNGENNMIDVSYEKKILKKFLDE